MTSRSLSLNRRNLLGTTAAVAASSLIPGNVSAVTEDTTIRPFRINVPEEVLVDLRQRSGRQMYDWRKVEARLNALPQFITEIDGLDIHFLHVRSKHENALALIVTHADRRVRNSVQRLRSRPHELCIGALTETLLKVMVANPVMIDAYKAGIPLNGKPFPDGSKIAKIEWKPKKSAEAPFSVRIPESLQDVFLIEKDSQAIPGHERMGICSISL